MCSAYMVTFTLPEGERSFVFVQPPLPQALVPAPEVSLTKIRTLKLFFVRLTLSLRSTVKESNQAKRGTFYHHGDNNQGRRRRWGPAVVAVMFLLSCVFVWFRSDHSQIEMEPDNLLLQGRICPQQSDHKFFRWLLPGIWAKVTLPQGFSTTCKYASCS